ncbi:MAG: type II secretion system protein GspF, partial [Candidatus Rokubacteria bacterium]|nr:type II secretion system protein GspF [Candidatus Rokubacteria bacterium]
MPVFVYKAADQRGKTITGVMEAPDPRAVVERLHREEYYPIEVAAQAGRPGLWRQLTARGISNRDLV